MTKFSLVVSVDVVIVWVILLVFASKSQGCWRIVVSAIQRKKEKPRSRKHYLLLLLSSRNGIS